MSHVVLILGGVPSLRVPAGVVIAIFTLFSLVISHIILFLVVNDKFSFHLFLSPLGVFAFGQSLPYVLCFLVKEFRFGANCLSSMG